MRYEVYDTMDDILEALYCAGSYNAKFVLDTRANDFVFGG